MNKDYAHSMQDDTISRQAAIDALKDMYNAAEKWGEEASDDVIKARAESCMASLVEMKLRIEKLPSAQPEITVERALTEEKIKNIKEKMADSPIVFMPYEQPERQWIPCSERLPEEDTEVLISYRYKEKEGDTSHTYIDITSYGQMYFGSIKVGEYKHWREPFEYFSLNYEVIAWMPLPEPWKGEQE